MREMDPASRRFSKKRKKESKMKAAIYPNFRKKNALECSRRVCDIMNENGIQVYVDECYSKEFADKGYVNYGLFSEISEDIDAAVAVGGDGTILKCAKYLVEKDTLLIGINTGRLGFMSALEYDQLEQIVDILKGKCSISERMLLTCKLKKGNDSTYKLRALNDITITAAYSDICDFNVYCDDLHIGSYRADGAIFSTPTGSTAYSLSAGGPIIEPDMKCIEMTLICPHSLFTRPMIFSPHRKLRFENSSEKNPELFISVDGGDPIKLHRGASVEITGSRHVIKLADMATNNFFNSLNEKFMRPIK